MREKLGNTFWNNTFKDIELPEKPKIYYSILRQKSTKYSEETYTYFESEENATNCAFFLEETYPGEYSLIKNIYWPIMKTIRVNPKDVIENIIPIHSSFKSENTLLDIILKNRVA